MRQRIPHIHEAICGLRSTKPHVNLRLVTSSASRVQAQLRPTTDLRWAGFATRRLAMVRTAEEQGKKPSWPVQPQRGKTPSTHLVLTRLRAPSSRATSPATVYSAVVHGRREASVSAPR